MGGGGGFNAQEVTVPSLYSQCFTIFRIIFNRKTGLLQTGYLRPT
jgi:hypothetical protein